MERKNIFQRIDENYDVVAEIKKINKLFENEKYFFDYNLGYCCSFRQFVNTTICKWEYAGTCLNSDEFLKKANAKIDIYASDISEECIINNLEALDNFLFYSFVILDKSNFSLQYPEQFTVFINLIRTLEARIGLVRKQVDGVILLYPKNAPLEQVIEIVNDNDVEWELIKYTREQLSLAEKRKSLSYLATNLYIEDDSKETNQTIKSIMSKTTNILNNLHIRHNNTTGKWENAVLNDITEKDAVELCDLAFNQMLTIVLLREQKKYEATYNSFNTLQKQAKNRT